MEDANHPDKPSVSLSRARIDRIADAWRDFGTKLKTRHSSEFDDHNHLLDVQSCAVTIFDDEARKLRDGCKTEAILKLALRELALQIIEGWERLMPVRFRMRIPKRTVQDRLRQILRRRADYWLDQWPVQPRAGGTGVSMDAALNLPVEHGGGDRQRKPAPSAKHKQAKKPSKSRSVRMNGSFLKTLRLDAGFSLVDFVTALGSNVKKTTYKTAESSGRIDIPKAHLLLADLNAMLRPKKADDPLTFEDLTLPD